MWSVSTVSRLPPSLRRSSSRWRVSVRGRKPTESVRLPWLSKESHFDATSSSCRSTRILFSVPRSSSTIRQRWGSIPCGSPSYLRSREIARSALLRYNKFKWQRRRLHRRSEGTFGQSGSKNLSRSPQGYLRDCLPGERLTTASSWWIRIWLFGIAGPSARKFSRVYSGRRLPVTFVTVGGWRHQLNRQR